MKISPHTEFQSTVTPATQAAQSNVQKASQGAAENAKSSGTSTGVSVSVSTLARTLEKPEVSNNAGDIDHAKVQAVKASIQNGTYKVNPEAIADKLLSNAQEMLNGTSN